MPYLGSTPNASFSTRTKQDFTANGSTTAFTLSSAVASPNDIEVFVGNVRQEPTDAYTVNGTTLTMSEAPDVGLNFYVVFKGLEENSIIPADGTISSGKIAGNAISTAKIASSAVTDAKIAGMVATKLTGTVSNARFPAGSVVQVVRAEAPNVAFTTTNSTPQDTGHQVAITPQFSDSDILIQLHTVGGQNSAGRSYKFHMKRTVGGASDTNVSAFNLGDDSDGTHKTQIGCIVYDTSVTDTQERIYRTKVGTDSVGTAYYNYQNAQSKSQLIAMEIKR